MARRPNLLLIMADQLAPQMLSAYGHARARTPHIDRLAEQSVVFENAYCNFPLCAPSRYSMLSGRLPSRIGAFDNAAEFPASVPTFTHYLRLAGYRTCLAGKMHFVGPDQLHGYEERITTDIYPSAFLWSPDWRLDDESWVEWYHSMRAVLDAGPHRRSVNIAYDDEVAFEAIRWLHERADDDDDRPFALTVSFISPHDPYLAPPSWWERYRKVEMDRPAVADIPLADRDPHSRRHWFLTGRHRDAIGEADVLRMRRAYCAVTGYVDAKIGKLLDALDDIGAADDTMIVFTSDHGDLLGERGMFFKMSFFEWSLRVPLILRAPFAFAPRRVRANVSLLDLFPTLLEASGDGALPELAAPIDGRSLAALASASGAPDWPDLVCAEYTAEGARPPADGPKGPAQADRGSRRPADAVRPRRRSRGTPRPRPRSRQRRDTRGAGSHRRPDLGCRFPGSGGAGQPGGAAPRRRGARHRRPHALGPPADARRVPAVFPRAGRCPAILRGLAAARGLDVPAGREALFSMI